MANPVIDILPHGVQTVPVVVAGILTLAGLALWGAGIRVARVMVACLFGAVLSALAMWILPAASGMTDVVAGIIGMAAGVLVGIVAFRFMQGVVLALCLGVVVCGGYYRMEMQNDAMMSGVHRLAQESTGKPLIEPDARKMDAREGGEAAQRVAGEVARRASAQWQAIPASLRQRMLILGLAVAVAAIALAWMIPKHITWVMTSVLGSALVIYGAVVLLNEYVPKYQQWVPVLLWQRLIVAGAIVLAGMAVQRAIFWPARKGGGAAGPAVA